MPVIALEEHFVTAELEAAWAALPEAEQDPMDRLASLNKMASAPLEAKLHDLGDARIAAMDAAGIDVAILSPNTPGVQNLAPDIAVTMAREINDFTAATVRLNPARFGGFAILPTPDPAAAARELERAMRLPEIEGVYLYGRSRDRRLDDPALLPMWEAAAATRAPVYLHPQVSTPAVREQLYGGFDEQLSILFSGPGIGWHYETGIHIVRLILAGVFDRFPDLQIVTGHWGEAVLFYLDRLDTLGRVAKLKLPISDYFRRNISVTPSGMTSQRYFRWALEVLGAERIMFSTDYPYISTPPGGARTYLDAAGLSDGERALIEHGDGERLTGRKRG